MAKCERVVSPGRLNGPRNGGRSTGDVFVGNRLLHDENSPHHGTVLFEVETSSFTVKNLLKLRVKNHAAIKLSIKAGV